MSLENNEFLLLSNVKHERHASSSRSIHPYFGKVDPALSTQSIRQFSGPDATVLDPFCGSGTVIHDAIVAGRSAIGWDSSPLAVLIATGKVLGVSGEEKAEMLEFIETRLPNLNSLFGGPELNVERRLSEIPSMPRVRSIADWFTENSLVELSTIKNAIAEAVSVLSAEARLLLTLSFSRIIISASKQQGESTYRRVEKADERGRVLALYRKAVKDTIKAAEAFNHELREINITPHAGRLVATQKGYVVKHGAKTAEICIADARVALSREEQSRISADLVVTSPPYLMSWDYGLYHKFRFYWLDFDLDTYEETEIGRHLRRKNDDVEKYTSDMTGVFQRLSLATTNGARIVMVNAPSIVKGSAIDTNKLLIELAAISSWQCIWSGNTLNIPGPHHGMYGSLTSRGANAPGSAGKREHVIVLEKKI